jgi:hypothetical protein
MKQSVHVMTRLVLAAAVLAGASMVAAQVPASTSAPKVKELSALMTAKKLEAFAMKESGSDKRFLAVMVTPNVQALAVSAAYSRPSDIEYWIYQKDYAHAYGDLVSGTMASERFFVEDIMADGLVAVPAKPGVADTVTVAGAKQLLEGPADPKKHNDKRMALDAYTKIFTDADKTYCALLDAVIAELKKSGVAPVRSVR